MSIAINQRVKLCGGWVRIREFFCSKIEWNRNNDKQQCYDRIEFNRLIDNCVDPLYLPEDIIDVDQAGKD